MECERAVVDGLRGAVGQGARVDEPLLGDARLHHRAVPLAVAEGMGVRFHALEQALGLEVRHVRAAPVEAVHAGPLAGRVVQRAVVVEDADDREPVSLAHAPVVRVVAGRDLHGAGAELAVHLGIGDDGDFAPNARHDGRAADQMAIPLVVRVHRHGGVAEHRLGTGGSDHDVAAVPQRIANVPEMPIHGLVLDLQVADGRAVLGAPVHQVLPAIDEALFVEAHKGLAHGPRELLVHREALARPVRGRAQTAELLGNARAEGVAPPPKASLEALPADLVPRTCLTPQLALDHGLRGDGRVVRARNPERGASSHAVPANHQILVGHEHHVAVVQRAGDVWRRNGDDKRLACGVVGRGKETRGLPAVVPVGLHARGVVGALHSGNGGSLDGVAVHGVRLSARRMRTHCRRVAGGHGDTRGSARGARNRSRAPRVLTARDLASIIAVTQGPPGRPQRRAWRVAPCARRA